MRELGHSPSGDNNLVLIHLWEREILLKCKKIFKCFVHDFLEKFYFAINSLKMIHSWKGYPANIYLFKVNNRSTKKKCEIFSKLTTKTPERRQ